LPIGEIVGKVSDTVGSVSNFLAEVQRTKQVVANAELEKVKAVEETRRVLGQADVRHHELDNIDRQGERDHAQVMARLQLHAQELADARAQSRDRLEKEINQVEDRLIPPRGRLK
jgi:hypothetical protein